MEKYEILPIATIHNDFKEKFGIPRQSNLAKGVTSTIIFEESFRDKNALRGLSEFSHIWLLWIFSQCDSNSEFNPTVRPPRLGGNKRMGVFSTRSPYHPNRIGLSCVKLEKIYNTEKYGLVLEVSGADLLDSTPIIDIKPYLAFTDSIPDAICGFADQVYNHSLDVIFLDEVLSSFENDFLQQLKSILTQDPRPSYQDDPQRVYSMRFSEYDVKFKVNNSTLTVTGIFKI